MLRMFWAVMAVFFAICAPAVSAQSRDDVVWVQIEAQPSLAQATDRARAYATLLQDVNGFALGGGWYGIAVGPYRRDDAELVLRSYRQDGLVPRDSFIQLSTAFRQQFWPVGANVLDRGVVNAPQVGQTEATPPVDTQTSQTSEAVTPVAPADETPAEAQRSERLLTRDEKKDLQVALKWAGYYSSGIDGSFGRGTRNSMAAWQEANGFEKTGILTTLQRVALFKQYNAVLDGLGLEMVTDSAAGIAMVLPTSVVKRSRDVPPFVHYDATGQIQSARVLLISQAGNQDTLFGLYDIMQTLDIVPLNGPRSRNRSSFELTGKNGRFISHTQATLSGGQIKGFTLIWPINDEDRRTRLLAEMQKSFVALPAVLDPAAGDGDAQAIDLVAGLQIRKPKLSRSGFFVDASGAVVTTSQVVQGCTRITLDRDTDAEVIADDKTRGVAVLRPRKALAPQSIAVFAANAPRLQSEIAVAGFPYEGVLGAASMTFGKLADVRGLKGEPNINRLEMSVQPGDSGGPVLDFSGIVTGMLLPAVTGARQLPSDVSFALDRNAVMSVTADAGLNVTIADHPANDLAPVALTRQAAGMTVLVSCWD